MGESIKTLLQQQLSAGADTFVAGSAIFNSENYAETISQFREKTA